MQSIDRDKQAETIARRYYSEGLTRVSYDDVHARLGITENTWYNYSGYLKNAGLVRKVPSNTGVRKSDLEITDKGLEVIAKKVRPIKRGRRPNTPTTVITRVLTPQALQDLVDKYNNENPSWRFELVPSGFRKENAE